MSVITENNADDIKDKDLLSYISSIKVKKTYKFSVVAISKRKELIK
jgi:hypothetical protein